MANTLTGLIPTLYMAANIIGREMIGAIPAVSRDNRFTRVAVGQTVRIPIVPPATTGNVTPAATPPDDGDQTLGFRDITITKSKYSPVRWNGEEVLALGPMGQYNQILADQFVESMRILANEIEVDVVTAMTLAASRAYGTAGQTPFGTAGDLSDVAGVNRILDENGAPQQGRRMVLGPAARQNLEGKQSTLFKVNEAGTAEFLRNRSMGRLMNFETGFSHFAVEHTKGTGTGYDFAVAGEAVGQTVLSLEGGTAGATGIKAGDVITFAGDPNKYVVGTGITGASGDIIINDPGLRVAGLDAAEMTIGNNFVANLAFLPQSTVLAARAPALPPGGDMADDRTTIRDAVSGLEFEVSVYRQYRQVKYEVAIAWGVGIVKEAFIAILLG